MAVNVAAIGIMCKAPQPGQAKTRLAKAVGAVAASELSACFLRDVAAAIEAVPETLGRRGYAVYAPAGTEQVLRELFPEKFELLLQAGDDLGEALFGATRDLLLAGHDCVLLVNGDSPTLPSHFLIQAIEALRNSGDRMVLGPASDGGYYLIGLKRPHKELFAQIEWGTETVFGRTCERAAEIGLATTLLPEWYDIDDIETLGWLRDELTGNSTRFRGGSPASATRAFLATAPPARDVIFMGQLAPSVGKEPPLYLLAGIGAIFAGLTLATPFAFQAGGDNAFIALAIPASLLTLAATRVAERTPTSRALWLIFGIGIMLRIYVLLFDPLLSTDIFRYIWDGRVQSAGINPYRYFPAHDALAHLRDAAIFPMINRADYAVTIYPPVAEFFFLIVTRIGENVNVMRLALLGCEAVSVALIVLFLRRMERPTTRVVAYFWHPLPIWEIANNGHVDALAVALMLLGLWVALTGRAMRGAVFDRARGAREAIYCASVSSDLAAVGLEDAARCDRGYCALLSSVSFRGFGSLRVPDQRLFGGRRHYFRQRSLATFRLASGFWRASRRCRRLRCRGSVDPAVYDAFGRAPPEPDNRIQPCGHQYAVAGRVAVDVAKPALVLFANHAVCRTLRWCTNLGRFNWSALADQRTLLGVPHSKVGH